MPFRGNKKSLSYWDEHGTHTYTHTNTHTLWHIKLHLSLKLQLELHLEVIKTWSLPTFHTWPLSMVPPTTNYNPWLQWLSTILQQFGPYQNHSSKSFEIIHAWPQKMALYILLYRLQFGTHWFNRCVMQHDSCTAFPKIDIYTKISCFPAV